jgi:hypothetical protein|tara:strand:+ start:743 stop:1123 length:381 start_codon:yes stop_codon:yes gene_type:complete
MATVKRIEKRLNIVEDWMKQFQQGTGPAQTMDNMNWLVAQLKMSSQTLDQNQGQMEEMNNVLQRNAQLVQQFVEEQDCVMEWQSFIAELQQKAEEEQKNAVQVEETESVDARKQAGDGAEVGEGDA